MVKGFVPESLAEALELRSAEQVTPYCGGTDLMVEEDEKAEAKPYLFLHRIPEMKEIRQDAEYLRIGAACTFTQVLASELVPKLLKEAISRIAAPAIRNLGSIGGNIGNGSAKADTALIFFVTGAKLSLRSKAGERVIPIAEFYKGRKQLDLASDELIVEVLMPKTGLEDYYYQKVGARNALAISRVSFAGLIRMENGRIAHLATAFGAITEVILCRPDIDGMFIGKTLEEAKTLKESYLQKYEEVIQPIRGRISAEYRKDVCINLLQDFLEAKGI